ncbi:MAG: 16S rRNA (adenine(1518)-N(6)/adenine(1519)-N(6))-dimethyltransferase RsmA [Flavobacteriia bacterium]|nr:16S rRNA (adenine(1518)-N(6)/adenine(1519)-N(6))-dimethyltransferase RsmA [Flavobacteriia bacterium]
MSVRPKKYLGQHFLKDENTARKITETLSWSGYDAVLEIGPGMGVLTKYLIDEGKDISVVEIDSESVEYLKENYPKLKIYEQDFLKMDIEKTFEGKPICILGNFPYNISSQIVFKIIEDRKFIPEMAGMFQKEVAERICAKEGSKIYGILSVLTQAYYKAEYLFTVSENVFNPPPKVKSGVIRLQRHTEKMKTDEELFFQIVKTGFNQRRKTLRNALKSLIGTKTDFDDNLLNLRAEQLSVNQFIELTTKLAEWKKSSTKNS